MIFYDILSFGWLPSLMFTARVSLRRLVQTFTCVRNKEASILYDLTRPHPTSLGNNDLSLKIRPILYCKKRTNPQESGDPSG